MKFDILFLFRRGRLMKVLAVSIVLHLLVGVFFGSKVIFDMLNPPEPMLEAPPIPEGVDPIKREYQVKLQRSQQQSSSPRPAPIAASLPSDIALDNIDLEITNPRSRADLRGAGDEGMGDGFGTGFGAGFGFELDVNIEFFGTRGGGKRVVFVVDYSQSMAGGGERSKDTIMRREMIRVLEELDDNTEFGMIFFAGPAWDAFEEPDSTTGDWVHSGGPSTFRPKDWNDLPEVEYHSGRRRDRAIDAVEDTPLIFGTIYDAPLFMALRMRPTADTIFFMTDGACSEDRGIVPLRKMITQMREAGLSIPKINTVGFGISSNRQLTEIAQLTGGQSNFLTVDEYINKYGGGDVAAPENDDNFNAAEELQQVDGDEYPPNFSFAATN
ncbi:MAG: hypothetical protein ACFB21_01650 [Opitutales bacterium]